MKKVWLVVTSFNDIPRVLGIYSTKEKAEKIAYTQKFWCNVIEEEVKQVLTFQKQYDIVILSKGGNNNDSK